MVWKSKGDNEIRKYDFTYDTVNRLTGANFNQYISGSNWSQDKVNFTVSCLSYDANGNILTMNQMGLKGTTSATIDSLLYTYVAGSNKLQNVIDRKNDTATLLGDFRSSKTYMTTLGNNKTIAASDYSYDGNGNLTLDKNKNITQIEYNYLNLPQKITISKDTIKYVYDAAGNKLKKIVCETGRPVKTTLYLGGAIFENDTLQFIAHEEGRIRPVTDSTKKVITFAYDYFLKDHLGNVRMVLTGQKDTTKYPALTFETTNKTKEMALYENADKAVTPRPTAMGDATYNGNSVQLLKKNAQAIGGGKLLKVISGDKLNVQVDYYFPDATVDNSSANGLNTVLTSLVALIDGGATGAALKGSGTAVNSSLNGTPAFTGLLSQQSGTGGTTMPKAYLNILFFDEQFKFVGQNSQVIQVSVKNSKQQIQKLDVEALKNGYVYAYVNNESNNSVYFDNLQLTHIHGPILEETHYYPFGLTMAGISSKALNAGSPENKKKFNAGSELQDKEFSDGSGLDWYATNFRSLDPQLGRWWQIDPKPDYTQSMYSSMGNNPILHNDPLGDTLPSGRNIYDPGGIEEYELLCNPNYDGYNPDQVISLNWSERLYLLGHAFGLAMPTAKLATVPSVWRLNSLERGLQIEQRLGGNLPKNFPVIDKLSDGVATSIKSVDLTLKTYNKGNNLLNTLKGYVNKLDNFATATREGVRVKQGVDFTSKSLEVGINPLKASLKQWGQIVDAMKYAKENNIQFNLKFIFK